MSTILDALKKSEQERKLNKLPTLSDMAAPREQSRWPQILVVCLLLVALLMLTWFGSRWWAARSVVGQDQAQTIVLSNETVAAAETPESDAAESDEIVVNVVSYSEQASQRFVMINGKMYRENEFIKAGLKVQQIKPDSVVLNQRGRHIERQP